MKNFFFSLFLVLMCAFTYGQELIIGGDMTNEEAWIGFWRSDAPDEGVTQFDYKKDKPFAGEGGCLDLYGFGQTGALYFQKVTITPGHRYSFTGAFKSISSDPLTNTWVELILSDTRPNDVAKGDYGAGKGDYIYAMNSWMTAPFNDMAIDGTFQDNFQFTWKGGSSAGTDTILTGTSELVIPDTVTVTDWWVSVKAGCWNTAGEEVAPFDFLVDDISLIDLGTFNGINPIAKVNSIFKMSPNPSTGMVTFTAEANKVCVYTVADLTGRVMLNGLCKGSSTLDISHLNKGVYVVHVKSGTKSSAQKLILR
jgi:hypothetical protein